MKDELISRQAAIDAVRNIRAITGTEDDSILLIGKAEIQTELMMLPSAEPEIIRCKECRYYEWMSNRVPDEQTWFCHNWNAETGKDDYCSYAERREE